MLKSHWRKITEIPENLAYSGNPETADLLEKVLALPEHLKLAVYLHYYEGYKTGEIAKIMAKPEPTVRGYLHRGRKALKLKLESEE
jgi:RNA polymerase sigma-70 factor (ECF subfamily)